MKTFRRGDLTFDVLDTADAGGPADGEPVVLLHGFPQFNTSWDGITARLTAQGYRCLAPNQRGYSPGARPGRRRDYRLPELVEDIGALLDSLGAQRVHLVGHDWGAAVAWGVAGRYPERVASLSALAVPHPGAFLRAMVTSRQFFASWYMFFFQLPRLPEWWLSRRGGAALEDGLRRSGQTPQYARRDAAAMVERGALRTAINWYRGMPLSNPRQTGGRITVPTLYVWADNDIALLPKAAHATADHVTGDYRFETLHGASHWMLEERPDAVADMVGQWLAAHPA
ncbi:alpha/beta fold hydrolase [Mycolicibacter minnesotensis]